jgi:hypothetical protein
MNPEAIELGRDVVKNSYGRNEYWAAEILLKSLVESGKKKEARELVSSYLEREDMQWPNMKETQASFEKIKASLKE